MKDFFFLIIFELLSIVVPVTPSVVMDREKAALMESELGDDCLTVHQWPHRTF